MRDFTLNIIRNGQVNNTIRLKSGVVFRVDVQEGLSYQIVDEQGQLIMSPKGELVGNDLWIFLEGLEKPSVVFENYGLFNVIDDFNTLQEMHSTFAILDSAQTEVLSYAGQETLLASEVDVTASTLNPKAVTLGLAGLGLAALGMSAGADSDEASVPNTTITKPNKDPSHIGLNNGSFAENTDDSGDIAPKADDPKADDPKADDPNTDDPNTDDPNTDDPNTDGDHSHGANDPSDDSMSNKAPSNIDLDNSIVAEDVDGAIIGVLSTTDPNANDNHSYSVNDNRFEVSPQGELRLKAGISLDYETEPSISLDITTDDGHGGVYTETFIIAVNDNVTDNPVTPHITIDNVTDDNVVNIDESGSTVSVGGNVSGAETGQLITVSCTCPSCNGGAGTTIVEKDTKIDQNGDFSVDFDGADVAAGSEITVTVPANSGSNTAEAENSHTYTTDLDAPIVTVTLDEITGDNIIDKTELAQLVTIITGNISDLASDVDNSSVSVKINVNGTEYDAEVDGERFSFSVATNELLEAGKIMATAMVTDNSGNSTQSDVAEQSYIVDDGDTNSGPTNIVISGTDVSENHAGALIGRLSAIDGDINDRHTYTLNNHTDKFEIVGGVLKLKNGVYIDFDELSAAPTTDYPTVRQPYLYHLDITAQDSHGETVTKTIEIDLHNEYEGVTDAKDLPYFIAAEYDNKIYTHASTPNGWGNPKAGAYGGEDWSDAENIIGYGRKIVWGFGDPSSSDNDHSGVMAYTEAQKLGVRKALAHYEEMFDLTFEEKVVTSSNHSDDNNIFDVVFYRGNLGDRTLGYTNTTYFVSGQGNDNKSNDVFISTAYYDNSYDMQTGDSYLTILHEFGHAVGLNHVGPGGSPPSNPFLPASEENQNNSIMSYNAGSLPFDNSLAIYDKITLEYMYGLNDDYHGGDRDVYTYDADLHYIADGSGGRDTLLLDHVTKDVHVNLTPGSLNFVGVQTGSLLDEGQFFIGYDTQIEILHTGSGNDYIVGGTSTYSEIRSGAGNDVIVGGAADDSILDGGADNDVISGGVGNNELLGGVGDDVLIGYEGTDVLIGGEGNDIFLFERLDGSVDIIEDFEVGKDKVQLDDEGFTALAGKVDGEIMNYIQYDEKTGHLSYKDGSNWVGFADVSSTGGHPILDYHSFEIV